MFQVSREIDFCYGHRLLNYEGKCRNLHGHNGRAAITIESDQLDHRGMVLDFSDIKKVVSTWIDDHLDHRMILHRDDPAVPFLQDLKEPLHLIEANPTAETSKSSSCSQPRSSSGAKPSQRSAMRSRKVSS